jgi:hypothetical protein
MVQESESRGRVSNGLTPGGAPSNEGNQAFSRCGRSTKERPTAQEPVVRRGHRDRWNGSSLAEKRARYQPAGAVTHCEQKV